MSLLSALYRPLCILGVFAAFTFGAAPVVLADQYTCNGVASDAPCPIELAQSSQLETETGDESLPPEVPAEDSEGKEATAVGEATADEGAPQEEAAAKISTRPKKLEREQPSVDVHQQLVTKNKLEIEATVKGRGPVKVVGTLSWRPKVSDIVRTNDFTVRLTLDDCGSSSVVRRSFIIPPSAAERRSNVTAENTGEYRGCAE